MLSALNDNFNGHADRVAGDSDVVRTFGQIEFSSMSLDDALVKNEEFGIMYCETSDWDMPFDLGHDNAINTLTINTQVILLAKHDTIVSVAIVRQAIVDSIRAIMEEFSIGAKVESTDIIDISARGSNNRYVASGAKATFKLGF